MELVASLPKPEGFFDPEGAGRHARRHRRSRPRRPAASLRTMTRRTLPPRPAGSPSRRQARSGAANDLSFANSDLAFSGNHLFVGNFHGFNTYDIENPRRPTAARLGGLPGRPGRRVGPRQSAVHVGRADARPDRLRHAGRSGAGQRRAVPRRPHLRHQRRAQAEAGRRRADLPRVAHAHARRPTRTTRRTCTSTDPARARCGRPRSSRAARARIPRRIRTPSLFSIDVIQVPLAAPETRAHRQPAAHLRRPGDRRDRGAVAGRRPRPGDADDVA